MFKTLLVHLDDSDSCHARLAAGIDFARRHDAHLIGLYPIADFFSPVYADVPIPSDLYDIQRSKALEAAERNRNRFDEELRKGGCAGEWRSVEDGAADYHIGRAACSADMVLVSQTADGEEGQFEDEGFVGRIVVRSPAPVLVVPASGSGGALGQRVLVAWNDTREAARAVHNALPLLAAAEQVEVMTVSPGGGTGRGDGVARCDALLRYLALHGVNAVAAHAEGNDGDAGKLLLQHAVDTGCDLLVSGGYGHSRLREAIFGGVTRHLLDHATIPVLMSH